MYRGGPWRWRAPRIEPGITRHRLTLDEISGGRTAKFGLVLDHRCQERLLIDCRQQRPSQLRVIKRWLDMVERKGPRRTKRVVRRNLHARRLAKHRAKIDQGHFEPVDLACSQSRRRGPRIRLHDPFDTLDIAALPPARKLGGSCRGTYLSNRPWAALTPEANRVCAASIVRRR
jgi:hypothetical protein